MPLTNPDSDPANFVIDLEEDNKKPIFKKCLAA
jgi:hypothetical protein